ncbi:MAG: hypothetical protein GXX85_11315 [Ignavibacteria bacterium]|nr:hypothetical protein [Ignavibacteria bacterium]
MKIKYFVLVIIFCVPIYSQPLVTKMDSTSSINGFVLEKNNPNPYGSISYIKFNLPIAAEVKIHIQNVPFDSSNYQIDTLSSINFGILTKGFYKFTWDLKDKNGIIVDNGFYDCFIYAIAKENEYYFMEFNGKSRIIVIR